MCSKENSQIVPQCHWFTAVTQHIPVASQRAAWLAYSPQNNYSQTCWRSAWRTFWNFGTWYGGNLSFFRSLSCYWSFYFRTPWERYLLPQTCGPIQTFHLLLLTLHIGSKAKQFKQYTDHNLLSPFVLIWSDSSGFLVDIPVNILLKHFLLLLTGSESLIKYVSNIQFLVLTAALDWVDHYGQCSQQQYVHACTWVSFTAPWHCLPLSQVTNSVSFIIICFLPWTQFIM